MNELQSKTVNAGEFLQELTVRAHTLRLDEPESSGGHDAAPDPHDLFDAALAACKSATAIWYAKRHGIPLERVDVRLERDDTEERKGVYRMRVHVDFVGALSDEQRATLARAIAVCPIHKLMTTADVQIEMV